MGIWLYGDGLCTHFFRCVYSCNSYNKFFVRNWGY